MGPANAASVPHSRYAGLAVGVPRTPPHPGTKIEPPLAENESAQRASSVTHEFDRVYDDINRLTQAIEIDRTDSNNKLTTKNSWDSRSNLVFRINAENNSTRFTFDPLSRLIKRERALATGATLDDITQAQVGGLRLERSATYRSRARIPTTGLTSLRTCPDQREFNLRRTVTMRA